MTDVAVALIWLGIYIKANNKSITRTLFCWLWSLPTSLRYSPLTGLRKSGHFHFYGCSKAQATFLPGCTYFKLIFTVKATATLRRTVPAMPSVFEYPVTRPFTLPYLTLGVAVFGVVWTTFITLVNVAAIGYESLSVISASFNSTGALWYEKFPPTASWIPKSWTCDPSTIQLGQGSSGFTLRLGWYLGRSPDNFRQLWLCTYWPCRPGIG
jgi:hypothetical protein